MTTPSKVGPAVLIVFGLPFLVMGLLAMLAFSHSAGQSLPARIGAVLFASVFAIIGAGLIFGSLYGYSRQKEQAARELANPTSPWLWRQDWAASRVESKNKTKAIGWWVGTVLLNMISLPIFLAAVPRALAGAGAQYIVPAIFQLLGLLVLAGAIRATIRFERFGKTYFELNSLPFSPGSHVAGAIHLHMDSSAAQGVDLTLSCQRRIVTGSGDNRSTQILPLWEDSKNVPQASFSRGPLDTVIPVDFVIPADAYQTNQDNPSDQVVWVLKARADVPGVDYSDQFELPVFRTSRSPAAAPAPAPDFATGILSGFSRASTVTPGETSAEVPEPANHRVQVRDLPDGLEFYFRPARNVARAALVVSLAIGISALFYALLHMDRQAPKFAFVVVGLLDFFLILAAIHTALSSTRIFVGNGTISWRRAILGIPSSSRQMQISEVDSIVPLTSIQQASSAGSTLYTLRLTTKNGKNYTLADDIASRQEARWIVSQMEKRAGLRLNTRVEIANGFYGPPPQPATASPGGYSISVSGARANTTNKWSVAFAIAFAILWLGFFAFFFRGMPFSRNANRAARRTTASRTASAFERTPRMKQASLEEVSAWPPQQQAEELMARSIEHDAAALPALNRDMPQWIGKVQLTGNLRQLEDRARYSSDLRVRRAEANLELTLDGWSRTPNSVDTLVSEAKSNPTVRARSLYFLGILAGDGIKAEPAHQLMIQYARTDPDASVRQWAAEGLRFLGTDQALDELFEIFTHDASFAVRDRAGCNISDCGIFKRSQRLRMVPRLIDLVSDPTLDSRMRGWSFLALREITDENLPPDAAAWRRWYTGSGSAKQTQFAALDWWQVRGDN